MKFFNFDIPPVDKKDKKQISVLDSAPKRTEVSKDYSEKREALVKYLNKLQVRHDKNHKLDRIQTSPQIKAEQMERIFNLAEAVQRKINGSDKAREDFDSLLKTINDIYPELVEPLRVSYVNPERGRQLLAAALAALITLSSAGQVLANTNTPGFVSGVNTTLTFDKYAKFQDDKVFDLTKPGYKTEGGGEGGGEGDPITLASAYFKTGTVEYKSLEAREAAKRAIHKYLTRVDLFEGGLENSTIFVKGQSSAERPTDMNDDLARQRTEEGLKLVKEVLDTYFEGRNVDIETVIESNASVFDGMSPEQIAEINAIAESSPDEFAKMVDAKQSIVVEAVTKTVESPSFNNPEDYSNVSVIFGDKSGTMKDNMGAVELLADKVNELREPGDRIKIIDIQGGNNEQHLQTILNYLESADGQNSTGDMFLITDEGVNQLPGESADAYNARYDRQIAKVLELGKGRPIMVKFLDPRPGSYRYKVFNLNDKPDGLKREARPTGVTAESPKFTEEKLNRDLFEKIERYQDNGDKPEQEEANDDKTFHSIAKGKKGK